MALSKTPISAEGPRRSGFDVWPEWNKTGRNRAICVSACAERSYVSNRAAKVVRVLTKNGGVGGGMVIPQGDHGAERGLNGGWHGQPAG